MMESCHIWITGIVQGVGFRPYVYNLAKSHQLKGWVNNTSNGVNIHVEGETLAVQAFITQLQHNPPPLAQIDQITVEKNAPEGHLDFTIQHSQDDPADFIPISADVATCADCHRELFNPTDRRFHYPFINCTNCGPRFSIIKSIPYDRPNTTMRGFNLCPECQAEYQNPQDRRFHAQPIACTVCGPQISLLQANHNALEGDPALLQARQLIKQGKILAVKGLGGFHLVCDAKNPAAVTTLRQRKQRIGKPFALMTYDLQTINAYAQLTKAASEQLASPQAPIVLLDAKQPSQLAPDIAPGQYRLGFMLPYTPLHWLLLEPATGYPDVLVMTSGNLSDEPIAYRDDDGIQRLSCLADAFLLHNRPIHMRVDDSVMAILDEKPQLIRRSRGFAPNPLRLKTNLPPILAVGAMLKNTFCLTRNQYAFISHYIGDLQNAETLLAFEQGISHYENVFRITPSLIACDLHQDYLSSQYAQKRSGAANLPLVQIQHHHAHIAACLAEHGRNSADPVIGVSFDGTGLGTDGVIWGGEFLLANTKGFSRPWHLAEMLLPGGEVSIQKPARMALSLLWQHGIGWDARFESMQALSDIEKTTLINQLERKINTPLTTSMGRLFDGVAALTGICQFASDEAQAAIELETAAWQERHTTQKGYPFALEQGKINLTAMLASIVEDIQQNTAKPVIAARFHQTVAQIVLETCIQIQHESGIKIVALSGGVWQNMLLTQRTTTLLKNQGFEVLLHRQIPCNDACISLGQAMIAANYYQSNLE